MHPQLEVLKRFALRRSFSEEIRGLRYHLNDCRACRLSVAALTPPPNLWCSAERRIEPRVPIGAPAKIKLLDPVTSTSPAIDAQVVDISWNGLALVAHRYFCANSLMQIRFDGKIVLGEVRYSAHVGAEAHETYRTGIRLVETLYERKHLSTW